MKRFPEHSLHIAADAGPSVPGQEDAERFWNSIVTEVSVALREYVNEGYTRYDAEEREEEYQKMLAGEEALVRDTLARVAECIGKEKPGRILFDIDETLGKARLAGSDPGADTFLFRPCAVPLVRHIKEHFSTVAIGFLTTRGKEKGVIAQLREPSLLGPLEAYADESEVYSTRDAPQHTPMNVEGEFEYLSRHPDVDPAMLDQENFYGLMPGEISKLEILKQLHERTPDIPTVVIDDFSYPQYLRNGVRAKIF